MLKLLAPKYWGGHALMVLSLIAAVLLGVWQLHAWEGNRADAERDLSQAEPVGLSSVMGGDSPFPGRSVGQPVTFEGRWLPQSTVYVAHRRLHGRDGYWVVTPVEIGRSAMLVVRGWSPRPDAPAPSGEVDVTGSLQATEAEGAPDDTPGDDVVNAMRIGSIVEKVDADLYSGYVVASDLSPGPTPALARVRPDAIPPVSTFTGGRNFVYAIQWWLFGGFAVFVWGRWCKDSLAPDEDEDADLEPDPDPEPVRPDVAV